MSQFHDRAARGEGASSSLRKNATPARTDADTVAAQSTAPVVEPCWDPYEVWLTRVKQPREQSRRQQQRPAPGDDRPATTDLSDTARLRALSVALPR